MAVSAQALRAGNATIELSLLEKRFDKQMAGLRSRITGAFKPLSAGIGRFPVLSGFRDLPGQVGRFRDSLSRLSNIQFPWLSAFRGLMVGAGIGGAIGFPIKLAADLEVAAASLAVFAGGTANAKAMLMELQEFAAVSLVSFDSLSRNAAMMLRMGDAVEKVIPHTKALAAIAMGSEEEFDKLALAFGQVASAGRLQGEEMRQFKNTAFNPLREIAERTGETMLQVKERMEAGKVSFDEVASALQAATGKGGRFHGLLETISKTLTGRFRQVIAKFKLAILPLGQQMLEPLKNLLGAVIGLEEPFKAFISKNSSNIKTIMGVAAAIGLLVAGFLAFKILLAVFGMALATIIAPFVLLKGLFLTIISPIGLIAAAIALLIFSFFKWTESGRNMANALGNYFSGLASIATTTFGGIINALKASNLSLAGEIAMAGLKVAWLQGTHSIRTTWDEWLGGLLKALVDVGVKLAKAWYKISNEVATRLDLTATLAKATMAAPEDKAGILLGFASRTAARKTEMDAAVAGLEALGVLADAGIDEKTKQAILDAQAALQKAKDVLAAKAKQAQDEADAMPPDKQWFGAGKFFGGADGLGKAMQMAKQPEAMFDTRLVKQAFGGTQDQQLIYLKVIAKNTGRGGGLPVI